jgi:hypothetical protein
MSSRQTLCPGYDPPGPNHADYDAIEAAVMETSRGRWFLAEYARRQRRAETETILAALDTLGRMIEKQQPPPASYQVSGRFAAGFRVRIPEHQGQVAIRSPQQSTGSQAGESANASHAAQDQAANVTQQTAELVLLRSALVGDELDSLDYRVLGKVA